MTCKVNILLYLLFIPISINGELKLSDKHEQVHLSLAKNPRTMVVQWTTFYDLSHNHRKPMVRYGAVKSYTIRIKSGHTKKLVESENANITRYFHTVYLKNLYYDKKYYYKVGDGKTWSKKFYFHTFKQGSNFKIKFCVLGDMDTGKLYTIKKLTKAAKDGTCQLIIHVGDIAYQLYRDNGFVGDEFMNRIEPIAAYIPYMVIEGNHEFNCKGFTHYEHRFAMPLDNNNIKKIDHFYSFKLGLVNFIALSTEIYSFYTVYGPNPIKRQSRWLEKTLEEIQMSRNERPWVIPYFHRPIYCWNKKISDECNEYESTTLRTGYKDLPGLEDHFYKNNVDLAFYGHEHGYERHYPIYNRTMYKYFNNTYYNPPAPTYILTGVAGCIRCHQLETNTTNESPFSAKRSNKVGYTHVNVVNQTHIRITQIDTEDNKIIDSLLIIKDSKLRLDKTKRPKEMYVPYEGPQEYPYIEEEGFVKSCVKTYNISLFTNKGN
uniref:Purple acid phosphatase n=1 Tax=Strongyloides papillosus TaxID=174720 RepID=A0A0N5BA91_STREA